MIVASWFLRQKKSRAGNSQKKTKKTGMNVHSTAEIQMIIALWFLRKEKNTGVEIRITEIRIVSASPQNKKENFFKFQTRKLSPYYIVKILPYWKSCFSIRNLNFAWSLIFLCYKRVSNLQFRTVDFFNGQMVSLFLFAVSLVNLKQDIFIQHFVSIFKTFFQLKKKVSPLKLMNHNNQHS